MKKPKTKKTTQPLALVIASEDAMIGLLNRLIAARLDLHGRVTENDKAIAALQAAHDEDVQELRTEVAMLESSIHLFCKNHRAELFNDGLKSKEYAAARIGFRDTPASVELVLAKDTLGAVCERMAEIEGLDQYVDWKPSLRKAALLRDRANLTAEDLAKAGITFEDGEQFFIDPKSEVLDRTAKPAEAAAA